MENQHHNLEAPQHNNMELETERQRVLKEKISTQIIVDNKQEVDL